MRINERGELVIHQCRPHCADGDNLKEAFERELHLAGLAERWQFNAGKIIFEE